METVILPCTSKVIYKTVACDYAGNNETLGGAEPYLVYQVIPEFPSTLILPLFIITTLLAVHTLQKEPVTLTA